jgi:hypothetical protein
MKRWTTSASARTTPSLRPPALVNHGRTSCSPPISLTTSTKHLPPISTACHCHCPPLPSSVVAKQPPLDLKDMAKDHPRVMDKRTTRGGCRLPSPHQNRATTPSITSFIVVSGNQRRRRRPLLMPPRRTISMSRSVPPRTSMVVILEPRRR